MSRRYCKIDSAGSLLGQPREATRKPHSISPEWSYGWAVVCSARLKRCSQPTKGVAFSQYAMRQHCGCRIHTVVSSSETPPCFRRLAIHTVAVDAPLHSPISITHSFSPAHPAARIRRLANVSNNTTKDPCTLRLADLNRTMNPTPTNLEMPHLSLIPKLLHRPPRIVLETLFPRNQLLVSEG